MKIEFHPQGLMIELAAQNQSEAVLIGKLSAKTKQSTWTQDNLIHIQIPVDLLLNLAVAN